MDNFIFKIPTELIFGKETHKKVGEEVKKYSNKILLVRLAKTSLERIGIYNNIMDSLKENNIEYIELDGIVPNPLLSKVKEGIEICKNENIKFVLAVGGGSVIDTAKAIAAGACVKNDVWDIFEGKIAFENSLQIGTVLTIPATGSEMNTRCVITNDENGRKKGSCLGFPTFSIVNPELCKTLPQNRIAESVTDMLAHSMERYFTNTEGVDLTDRMLEGVMKTMVRLGKDFYEKGFEYQRVSQLVYAATVSHNFSLCVGRENDFASHQLSHELSACYDTPHGAALSIIFPAWIKYNRNHNKERMAQFFVNVFNIETNFLNLDDTIDRGIKVLEEFYKGLDMPIKMSETGIKNPDIEKFANNITKNKTVTCGFYVKLNYDDIVNIYKLAL